MAAATASAQNFMVYQYGARGGPVNDVPVATLMPDWVVTATTEGAGSSTYQALTTWESNGSALVKQSVAYGPKLESGGMATVALHPKLVVTAGAAPGAQCAYTSRSISSTGGVTLVTTVLSEVGNALIAVNGPVVAMTRLGFLPGRRCGFSKTRR